jgi:release factor glutamine methyltransferase
MRWQQCVEEATRELDEAGIDDARTNAEYLASHVRHMTGRSAWRKNASAEVTKSEENIFQGLLQRRLAREPLQYILGEWEFFGLPMIVRPGVLIPRPETEILVEEALREASAMSPDIKIVDAGTGSGAIALAIASRLPHARVIGYDISEVALGIARENQTRLKLRNVQFERGDMLDPSWLREHEGTIDLLLSNPPYVSVEDFNALGPELRLFEPREALTDNATGLTFYAALVVHAKRLLAPNAKLLVELGYNVCENVVKLAEQEGLCVIRVVKDLAGIDRVLVAERSSN